MPSPTAISNLALDELPSARIITWQENSLQARTCRNHYTQAVLELLTRADWYFARKRVALALLAVNDRDGEWGSSYALPSDMQMIVRIPTSYQAVATGEAVALVGQTAAMPLSLSDDPGQDYDISGATIYTNAVDATLEYIAMPADTSGFTAQFIKALVLLLAVKISMPITKDKSRRDSLEQRAEAFAQRAIALNNNARPQRYGDIIPEAAIARAGGYPGTWRNGW